MGAHGAFSPVGRLRSAAPDEPSPTPEPADTRSLTDAPQPPSADGIAASAQSPPAGSPGASADAGDAGRQQVSLNTTLSVFGGIFAALLVAMTTVLSMQIGSLADSMDARFISLEERMDARFAAVDARFAAVDARIANLEAEMRAGFRDIQMVLLDHTDRLARLEALHLDHSSSHSHSGAAQLSAATAA